MKIQNSKPLSELREGEFGHCSLAALYTAPRMATFPPERVEQEDPFLGSPGTSTFLAHGAIAHPNRSARYPISVEHTENGYVVRLPQGMVPAERPDRLEPTLMVISITPYSE